ITIVTAVSYGPGARTGQVLLWPNPASGHIHISRLPLGATIELISALGSVVDRFESFDEQLDLSVSDYTPGTYMLRIVDEMSVQYLKLIIQK
ncbi:MAG: T9SS type A sorting domain-containing protein, partial [Bacteroidetes bacterium]|nr:T9SS type A sorting domain-containing protein [Bacteroidota bacterium]